MSKLFQLKKWITVPEAAKYLSAAFNEDVVASDILRLALDERIALSVVFVNGAYGRKGKLVPATEVQPWKVQLTRGGGEEQDSKILRSAI